MRIALFQTQGSPGDVEANITAAEVAAAQAKAGGADMLVLPEMFLSGYAIGELAFELAEPAEGDSARRMADAAAATASLFFTVMGSTARAGIATTPRPLSMRAGGTAPPTARHICWVMANAPYTRRAMILAVHTY